MTSGGAGVGRNVPGVTSSFLRLCERLSEASVRRRWDAYRDVDWDAPEHEVHPADPRWEAAMAWDPLGSSEWYRDQAPERRSAIGLYRQAGALKVAIEFERVLSDGLLKFAAQLPNGHPAFRYAYHEIAEEAQHSMMFQELVNRSGFDPTGAADHVHTLFDRVTDLGAGQPALFFLMALSGEEAFDYMNRRTLEVPATHPLLARISRIHITEEARHVSFARAFLRYTVPRLDPRVRRELRYQAAFVINWAATHMFEFTEPFAMAMQLPPEVHRAVVASPQAARVRHGSVAGVVALCQELGLVDDRLVSAWSRLVTTPPSVEEGS